MLKKTVDIIETSSAPYQAKLKKVGMENVEIAVRLEVPGLSSFLQVAKCDIYVSLDHETTKGIHMSRLYILLQKEFEEKIFSIETLKSILTKFLESHEGLSQKAYLNISYKHPVKTHSLKSELTSWKNYEVSYKCSLDINNFFDLEVCFDILYSSTCPCSAALSRQLIQDKFKKTFLGETNNSFIEGHTIYEWLGKEDAILATPHSQRSVASFSIVPEKQDIFVLEDFILYIENEIKTPVQTIVKREDEQEFALLNGQNLMFAEDIARKLKCSLSKHKKIKTFKVKISHLESLHAHNAVAYT